MQGKIIVALMLVLAGAGALTALVPVTPQVLFRPAVSSGETNYTTSTPYTVKYVQVIATTPWGRFESVNYGRIADSLRINVTLWHPLSSDVAIVVFVFLNNRIGIDYWAVLMQPENITIYGKISGPGHCELLPPGGVLNSNSAIDLPSCSITQRFAIVDVPLRAIGNPTKVYPILVLRYYPCYIDCDYNLDAIGLDPYPEVDLNPGYVGTLTRSFETFSTYTWTYTSSYTANVPIGAKMPWVPLLLIAGAGLLGVVVLIYLRSGSSRNPPEAHAGPKDA